MATLFNTRIFETYQGLIKTIDNAVITASLKELTDGSGNQTGLYINTAGDFKVTNVLEWGSLKDTGTGVIVTRYVTSTDGIENFDNNTSLPTTAAVKLYVDTKFATSDTLQEVLSFGNTTGGNDIVVSANDDITFTDSSKAIFGASADLQIYHAGGNGFIQNTTGQLNITDSIIALRNQANNESMLRAVENAQVELYYNNSIKLQTTITGVTITGRLSGLTDPTLAQDAATKSYVDALDAGSDLDFKGDNGTAGDVNLNTQRLDILGTANQITTVSSGQSLTIGMPTNITISGIVNATTFNGDVTGNVTGDLTGNVTATSVLANGVTATTQASSDDSTKVATTAYVKGLDNASDLDFSGTTGTGDVNLNTQTFAITGTANQIVTAASNQGLQISLLSTGVTMPNGSIATTQSAGDDSTKIATTSYVDTSAALYLPLTGGTMSGNTIHNDSVKSLYGTGSDAEIYHDGSDFYAKNLTGDLYIDQAAVTETIFFRVSDANALDVTALTISRSGDLTTGRNVTIAGDLTVNGTTTTVNSQTLAVVDPLIQLAKDNTANSLDIGLYGDYNDGTDRFLGLFSDASDSNKFKLFKGTTVQPTTTVDIGGAGYVAADLQVAGLEATNFVSTDITIADYIYHAGDGDTYIGFPAANEFKLVAGGNNIIAGDVNAAYLYYQGGVKLQTTNTGISVTGDLLLNDGSNDVNLYLANTSYGLQLDVSSGNMFFRTNGATRLTIENSGNATFAGDVIIDDGVGRLTLDSVSGANRIMSTTTGFGNYESLELRAEAYEFKIGTTEKFSINGSGNSTFAGSVTSPNFIVSDGTDNYIQFDLNGKNSHFTNQSKSFIFSGQGASGDYLAGTLNFQSRSSADRDINFITGATPTKRLTISGSGIATFAGNVGIGGVSASSQLSIGGNAITTLKPTVVIADTTNGASLTLRGQSPILSFDATAQGVPKILMDGQGIEFKTGTLDAQGDTHLTIDSSGNSTFYGRNVIENTTNLTTGVVDTLLIKTLSSGASITNGFGGAISFYLENTVYSAVNEVAKISVIETDTTAIDDKMVFSVKDNNTLAERLTLDGSGATFAGKILVGTGATAAASINAFTTTVSSNLFSALRVIENSGASSYWDIGAIGGASTLLNFYHNGSTTPKISFTHTGGATFAGNVTSTSLTVNGGNISASFNGSGTSYTQGAISINSSNVDTPEARGQGVFYFNEGKDTTWYTGTRYNDADQFIIGHATGVSLNTEAARTNNAFVTVNNVGQFGIGTIPEKQLHIKGGASDSTPQVLVQNSSTGDASVMYNVSGQSYIMGIDYDDSKKFKIASSGGLGTTDRITLLSGGQVGINTINPVDTLEVAGNIRANISNGGGFMITGASASGLVRNGGTGVALRTNTTDRLVVDNSGKVTISQELVAMDIKYSNYSVGSLDTTGVTVGSVTGAGNGSSAIIEFVGSGGIDGLVDVVFHCVNDSGNWTAYKNSRQTAKKVDVDVSGNGTGTLTFTFKSLSGSQSYTPRLMRKGSPTALITF